MREDALDIQTSTLLFIGNLCSNSPFNVPSSYMVKMIDRADILSMQGLTAPVFPKKSTELTKLSLPSSEACVSVVPQCSRLYGVVHPGA